MGAGSHLLGYSYWPELFDDRATPLEAQIDFLTRFADKVEEQLGAG